MKILVADQNALLLAAIAATFGQELEDAPAVKPDEAAAHRTPMPENPASEEPVAEFWAASGSAVEPSALARARHLAEASSFEVSFEVSFDENPSQVDATGHGVACADASIAPYVSGDPRHGATEAQRRESPKPTSSKPTASQPADPTTASKPAATKPPGRQGTVKVPRPRKPTVPTAAQREAFQRALARRNAARAAGMVDSPPIDSSSMSTMTATRPVQASGGRPPAASSQSGSSQSLADLARMATTKRPLPGFTRSGSIRRGVSAHGPQLKRRVFVVGSGIAAALLVAVVCFELLRTNPSHEHRWHARAASVQLFSPASTLVADNSGNPPQVFSPPPPQRAATDPAPGTASGLPQAQTFDLDTAPPDPPPPPALEHPGPMEPPSMGHHGRPPGLQDDLADE